MRLAEWFTSPRQGGCHLNDFGGYGDGTQFLVVTYSSSVSALFLQLDCIAQGSGRRRGFFVTTAGGIAETLLNSIYETHY